MKEKKNKYGKIVYYQDELNDDFSGHKIKPVKIDKNYKYIHKNIFWNLASFVVYRIIATPLAFLYARFKFKLKIVNKRLLKKCKNKGYFLYINIRYSYSKYSFFSKKSIYCCTSK